MQPDQNQPNPAQTVQPGPAQPAQASPSQPIAPAPAPSSNTAKSSSNAKKSALVILGIILVIFGMQGIYAEVRNDVLGLFSLFNLALIALGFVLIYNQLNPKNPIK